MKYIVEQMEVYIQEYEVEADTLSEAIEEVNEGGGIEAREAYYHGLLSDYTEIELDAYPKEKDLWEDDNTNLNEQ